MRRVLLAALGGLVLSQAASAQPRRSAPLAQTPSRSQEAAPIATPIGTTPDLRAHVGVDIATRLVRSSDPDERLRGIARAAEIGSPQAVAVLAGTLESGPPSPGAARQDPRALIEVARGLARWTDQAAARTALMAIVVTATPTHSPTPTEADDAEAPARVELAREIAALATAQAKHARAAEQLFPIARGVGPGQRAATLALVAFPPENPGGIAAGVSPQALRLAAQIGDLRSVDIVRGAINASDPQVRAAALLASAELGDTRAVDLARAAYSERDPRVRAAAAEALVLLDAPDRARAVEGLLSEDATSLAGARLAERVQDTSVSKALAARALVTQDSAVRAAVIAALGSGAAPDAVQALTALLAQPPLQGDAADALARSPSPLAMATLEKISAQPSTRKLAVRAYVVRALVRGERSAALDTVVQSLARASDAPSRAVGVLARVCLGEQSPLDFLGDPDPRVRRAAAMGALVDPAPDVLRALLVRRATERDEATRTVFGLGLLDGDPDGRLSTSALVDRAESGGPDAPLAAMALARRADPAYDTKIDALLRARDPVVRAHAARGLGTSGAKNASGRLADAWAYEPDSMVRRAVISALAARSFDAASPARQRTLETAASLDPDAAIRWIASRALAGHAAELRPPPRSLVAWIRLATPEGTSPAPGFSAALVRSDGLAVPVAFDDDGYAVIPGVPPGEARLVLAPRVPSYDAPHR